MGLWGRWFTYFEQSSCNYSGNQNPSCFQKTVETVLDRSSRVLDIALTVNVLVKHPRSGLPPTVLYNFSYLQLQLQLQLLVKVREMYICVVCMLFLAIGAASSNTWLQSLNVKETSVITHSSN